MLWFFRLCSGPFSCALVLSAVFWFFKMCSGSPGGVGGDMPGLHPAGSGPGLGRGPGRRAAHRGLQDSVVRAHELVYTLAGP